MKKRRIFIYIMVTIILICGIGYAYLNTDLSLENNVSLTPLKRYTVTFDYNDGVTEPTTKTVTYGKEYGSLPIPPEREGHIFKGWNGKNLFREWKKECAIDTNNGTEGYWTKGVCTDYIEVDFDKTNYYLSGITNRLYSLWVYYDEDYNYIGRVGATGRNTSHIGNNRDIVINNNKTKYIRFAIYENPNVDGKIDEYIELNTQLEEGNIATEYEPYYVTSDTKVTQDKNHTLTAIWEVK